MKKIFGIITLARQIDGDFVLVKSDRAFTKASDADAYAQQLTKNYKEVLQTPVGNVECLCERAILEFEINEIEAL